MWDGFEDGFDFSTVSVKLYYSSTGSGASGSRAARFFADARFHR